MATHHHSWYVTYRFTYAGYTTTYYACKCGETKTEKVKA